MNSYLVADIGGTHARCAQARLDSDNGSFVLHDAAIYECRNFVDIDQLLAAYRSDTGGLFPVHACLAVAGPVNGDRVTLTNNDWNFSAEQLRRRFKFEQLAIVNDWEAVARSVIHVNASDLDWLKAGNRQIGAPRVVIGAGTGLGIAGMVRIDGRWHAIASEAGHAAFAPASPYEQRLLDYINCEHGYVSWETVLSGPGIERLYGAIAKAGGVRSGGIGSRDITACALANSDPLCVKTVETFCLILARFVSHAVLYYGARGGVYLAGDICRSLRRWLGGDAFLHRFVLGGPMSELLEQIPIALIALEQPGLIGAAAKAHAMARAGIINADAILPTEV